MYDVLTIEDWVRRLYAAQLGQSVAQRLWLEPFSYGISFSTFNAVSGTTTGTLQINSNADFVLLRMNYEAVINSVQTVTSKPVGLIRAQITDAGNSAPFFNTALPLETFCAHQDAQRFLAYPRFLNANTTLQIQLTGYAAAAETLTSLDLVFEGMRVRQYSGGMSGSAFAQG